jgi:hypothetical protein
LVASRLLLGAYPFDGIVSVRLDAKRKALDALSSGRARGGYGTNNDTIAQPKPMPIPQVLEKTGGPGPSRTVDLTLIRGAL